MKIDHKSDDTRNRILVAAKHHFLKFGYDKTKLEDIVSEAHVSKTAIYKIFGGKQELFFALNDAILGEKRLELVETSKPMQASTFDEMRSCLAAFANNYLEIILHLDRLALLRLNISLANRYPKAASQFYTTGPETAVKILEKFFASLQEQKLLNIADSRFAATSFLALLRGNHQIRALLDPAYRLPEQTRTAHIDNVVTQFIKGAAPTPA